MHIDNVSFEEALEREARKFLGLHAGNSRAGRSPQRIIVADFEYRWDRSRYDGYCVSEGESAEPTIRWPFHRIAAASWLQLRFDPGEEVPAVESIVVLAEDEASEQEMIAQFFEALHLAPAATLVTWGGEVKDLAVLRRSAGEFALVLPHQPTTEVRTGAIVAPGVLTAWIRLATGPRTVRRSFVITTSLTNAWT